MTEGGRVHQLKVLLVLGGGTSGDLIDPLGGVVLEPAVTAEGGEELVVAGPAGGGDEAAHGEGVDELVVEGLIGGGYLAGEIDGGDQFIDAGWLGEGQGDGIDADAVLCGVADKGLGVDCSGEMHVQVGSLGEGGEEGVQCRGTLICGGPVGAGGVGFRRWVLGGEGRYEEGGD